MIEFIKDWLIYYGFNKTLSLYLSNVIAIIGIIFISVIVDLIVKKILLKNLESYIRKTKNKWDDILLENKVFERLSRIVPVAVIHSLAPIFPVYQTWIQRLAFSYIVFIILLSLDKFLDAANDIYKNYEISKIRPIKGYLQVMEIIVYIIGIIIIISVLIDRSPLILLSGIGAATAVLLLIFQNSILGLVASIQLASNNMVQIGDWIEMPKYEANGDVIDISLHTVKVQNWDKTITTIPTHALISDSFKNWRGMQESGGRRIKRSIYIDMTSIKFCTEEMLDRFKEIKYINEYLENKSKEIDSYNAMLNLDDSNLVNGRHLTNIGTFRVYIANFLENHPKVHKGMPQMVRQLQSSENGLPIEIYVFTNDTTWANYEAVQSDIFDHILSVTPEFDLRIYQGPTGHDLRNIIDNGALVKYTMNKL